MLNLNHVKTFTCEYCFDTFTDRKNRRRHEKYSCMFNNQQSKFQCDGCFTSFTRRDNLHHHTKFSCKHFNPPAAPTRVAPAHVDSAVEPRHLLRGLPYLHDEATRKQWRLSLDQIRSYFECKSCDRGFLCGDCKVHVADFDMFLAEHYGASTFKVAKKKVCEVSV